MHKARDTRSPRPTIESILLRICLRIAVGLLIVVIAACVLLYMEQRRLLYFPQNTRVPASDTNFALRNEGVMLRGWIENPGQERALLYFGGNGEPLGIQRERLGAMFPQRTVYLLAYRSYGASEGEPSEHALFSDALALYDHVRSQHVSIAVVGRSLGSGVAAYLVSQRPVERLALVAPFDSIVEVAKVHYPYFPVRTLMQDRYESTLYLPHYRGPVLVLRAGRDDVVPPIDTDRLLAAMPKAPSVVIFPEAGHNSIANDPRYATALSEFMK